MSGDFDPAVWSGSWLARRAALSPDRIALEVGESVIRYGELHEIARRLARRLAAAGVGAGEVVAARAEDVSDFACLVWGLRELGAVLLPLNPRLTAEEAAQVLRDSGVRLLVDDGEPIAQAAAALAGGLARGVLRSGDFESLASLPAGASTGPGPGWKDADGLALIYTSGTTGQPKGAMLPCSAFLASARGSAELLGTGPDERWLACMPLFHVGGLSILLRACLAGSAVVLQPGFDPGAVDRALERDGITGVSLVATMLQRLLGERGERRPPSSLRWVLLGGGPAPAALLAPARALGYPLAPTYGLTEAASQVATRLPADADSPLDGRLCPLPGTALKIVDTAGRVLPAGEPGEICIRGETLMRGYLGRPEATARALRDGWLHTGDVGTLDAGGRLRVLDRREDLIVSGGENVYPAEIEATLAQHPAVLEAAVVGEPDAEFGARPVAWWVAAVPGAEEPDLEAFCRERLAGYKVPRRFLRLASLPRNSAGKLLRRDLRGRRSGSEAV